MRARSSSRFAAIKSGVFASRLRRTSGSVLDMRTLHHQPSRDQLSTLTPSSSNTRSAVGKYVAFTRASTSAGSPATRELISPDCAYLRSGAMSSLRGLSLRETMFASANVAMELDSAVKFALK